MKREELDFLRPEEIEGRSMELIERELREKYHYTAEGEETAVLKRVIHTTADFDYIEMLEFSEGAVRLGREALGAGTDIVTDTEMAKAGINKKKLAEYGGRVNCYMGDAGVATEARKRGITRASVSMERTALTGRDYIYAIGNAPTALVTLYDMIRSGQLHPKLIIAVPVGFVNVVEAKELIRTLEVPFIVARGRRGGSNVAAAIVNALLYGMERKDREENPEGTNVNVMPEEKKSLPCAKGLIHLYYGEGRGKTSAASGTALRALHAGYEVKVLQFCKSPGSGEMELLKKLGAKVSYGKPESGFISGMDEATRRLVKERQEKMLCDAMAECRSHSDGRPCMLVLDEMCAALTYSVMDEDLLLRELHNKPEELEILMTGRAPSEKLKEAADYITYFEKQRHPFDLGITAREGIEY